jgi:hypothetical protein
VTRVRVATAALAFLLFSGVANADGDQTPSGPATAPIAPDVMAAAQALVEVQGGIEGAQATLSALRNQLVTTIAELSHKPVAEVAPIVDELILPELKAHADGLVAIAAASYASHFTVSELDDLRSFFLSPVGRKLTALRPVITQETSAAGRDWGRRTTVEAIRKHAEELRQRGLKI